MDGLIRLQKYLADKGVASRRKSEEFIKLGMVKVNGKVVTEMGVKVDPVKDKVEVAEKMLNAERGKFVYIKLNKPYGFECSVKPQYANSESVYSLVKVKERLVTVGRLDKESEGLILMTNDGRLVYQLTHPKFGKEKEYVVKVDSNISDSILDKFESGVVIMGEQTNPAKVERINLRSFSIVLSQGMNRQIRRMCRAEGFRVHKLRRVRVGDIQLGELPVGKWEYLNKGEMKYVEGLLA